MCAGLWRSARNRSVDLHALDKSCLFARLAGCFRHLPESLHLAVGDPGEPLDPLTRLLSIPEQLFGEC
jgi:hypothetical protein